MELVELSDDDFLRFIKACGYKGSGSNFWYSEEDGPLSSVVVKSREYVLGKIQEQPAEERYQIWMRATGNRGGPAEFISTKNLILAFIGERPN